MKSGLIVWWNYELWPQKTSFLNQTRTPHFWESDGGMFGRGEEEILEVWDVGGWWNQNSDLGEWEREETIVVSKNRCGKWIRILEFFNEENQGQVGLLEFFTHESLLMVSRLIDSLLIGIVKPLFEIENIRNLPRIYGHYSWSVVWFSDRRWGPQTSKPDHFSWRFCL